MKDRTDFEEALRHRYRVRSGGPFVPSVTGAIGIMDKPALKWASAKIAAQTAVDNIDALYEIASAYRDTLAKSKNPDNQALADAADEDVYAHWCRGEFDRVWREKANRGTRVHEVAERWVRGETVEVPLSDKGFVDALEAFYFDTKPRIIMAERIVVHPLKEYGGRFDAIAEIDGKRYLIDFKTGNEYTLEVALQASAYMNASLQTFTDDGSIGHFEKLPELDGARIIYLKEDGSFKAIDPFELISVEQSYAAFLDALSLYRSIQSINNQLKGK